MSSASAAAERDVTGYTHFASSFFSFTWKISNCFSDPNSVPFKIMSPEFKDHWGNSWVLEFYPTKDKIKLFSQNTCKDDFLFTAKISLLHSDMSLKDTSTFDGLTMHRYQKCTALFSFKFLEDLDSILKDDTVQICCEIWMKYLEYNGTSMLPEEPVPVPENDPNDFGLFFNNSFLSDFTVVVNSVEYPAHKFILAARSPVFSAMLKADMVETTTNRLVIPDFPVEVVEGMLKFIYSNKICSIPTESCVDYLRIAHTYDIRGLTWNAERSLIRSLSAENIVEMWKAGTMYGAKGLLNEVAVQIHKNYNEVPQSPEFAKLSGKELNEFWKFAIQATKMIPGKTSSKSPST